MWQILQHLQAAKPLIAGFQPNCPVKPKHSVNLKQISLLRPQSFPQDEPKSWLDRPDASESIAYLLKTKQLSMTDAQLCHQWIKDGYIVIKKLFDGQTLDLAWADYQKAIANGRVNPEPTCQFNGLPGRNLNTHFQVKKIAALLNHRRLTRIISLLMGAKCLPFQTITGHNGSQQLEHSDAIHMTTYPLDYLAAAWIAFEDINPLAGPLVYYPGSHRLPHFLSTEAKIGIHEFATSGYTAYCEKYEPVIQQIIQQHQLKAKYFLASKGDVLIWHSNLIHGGSPRQDLALSRMALVCHYFAQGCICYHDLTASLAHLHLASDSRLLRFAQKIMTRTKVKNLL